MSFLKGFEKVAISKELLNRAAKKLAEQIVL